MQDPIQAHSESLSLLTERQKEIALLAVAELTNEEIAAKTGLSESTVRVHLKAVFQRLGITRRTQLVAMLGVGPREQTGEATTEPKDLPRELKTLAELVASGATNAEIAKVLGRSPRSVKGLINECFRLVGVRNRVALAAWWHQNCAPVQDENSLSALVHSRAETAREISLKTGIPMPDLAEQLLTMLRAKRTLKPAAGAEQVR